ncbi:uncharacterized protein LOC107992669 [Apis cerana]|uniref:uncharacterized protein LOC107992669 n=1 Tax=Apis cerana TaxID=7461 RepID=UPI002B22BE4E|nr:uncharacterized protein LOC107992669 [Apis cerana]
MQSENQLDISITLSTFFLKNIGLWMSDDPCEQRRMRMLLVYTVWILWLGMIINGRDLYFTFLYNGDVLYALTNNITMVIGLIKIYVILLYKGKFLNLIVYMQQNFWNVNYDCHEKEILDDCRKTCIFFVSSITTIGTCAMISYLMTPFAIRSGNNESERMLPFNMWLDMPLSRTPYYEITFLVQAMCLYYIGISNFCFDAVFCIMATHLAGQFRILRYRFMKLCDMDNEIHKKNSILEERMHKFHEKFKEYVRRHQALIDYHQKLENVYTTIMLGQVLLFSIIICLFGYQVLLATASLARRSIFIFLLMGAMFLLFMFTFSCNGVMEQSDNVAVGTYSALWTIMPMEKFGKMLRKDLIMVIMRSRRVCCLTANGFFPISLETYTKILSTAVSYFTLLSNHVDNVAMQAEYRLDISINLSTFFLKNIGVWISRDPSEQRRMRMLLICTVWMLLLGIVINTRDLYFTLLYNGDILYVVTNNITLIISLVKICNIIIYKGKFLNLIVNMQENFWNVNYDYHEKEILDDCKKICIFFISSVTTIAICAIISYLMTPFIAQSGNNESDRMLPFNIWINLPLTRTPFYEIIFFIQAISLYYIGISSFCFDNIFCIMAVHLAGQFRILQYRLTKLCDTKHEIREKESTLTKQMHKFYEQFKECVRHHQALIDYHENLENVYTMITLGQVLVFSVLICLFGYQVLVATASLARRSIFVFMLNGSMFLLFMVTYSCNGVMEHSDNVAIGAYSALWMIMPMDKFGRMLRRDLIMVITRSRRVCYLTANGFFPVSLETYTKASMIQVYV